METIKTEELDEVIEQLTDENRRYFIGVLEALYFAQNMQKVPILEKEKG
ncbi:MAG: hypothetical protein LBC80_01475 [Treponema sp.]|jgi:DNA-binding MurR/RpiR family transcriptional regulator|nr:hypothetical protein [Treponema sp.]